MCLAALGLLFLTQWLEPISWPAFRWFVLLWVGFWANCYWAEEMFAFDALRIPAFAWVAGLGGLQPFGKHQMKSRLIDLLILSAVVGVNMSACWTSNICLSRNMALVLVSMGLLVAGSFTERQDLSLATARCWWVVLLQCLVTWGLANEVAWTGNTSTLRFQGFLSNPNSLSHPFLLLSMTMLWLRTLAQRTWALHWIASFVLLAMCGTRAALLAFALFTSALFAKNMVFDRKAILPVALSSAIVGIIIFLSPYTDLFRFKTILIGGGRFNAWPYALEEASYRPWLGYGAGYEWNWFEAHSPFFIYLDHLGNAHNAFLGLGMDYGIAGGSALFGWMAWRFQWFRAQTRWLFGLPLLIEMMFENWLSAPFSTSFLVMVATCLVVDQATTLTDESRADQKSTR